MNHGHANEKGFLEAKLAIIPTCYERQILYHREIEKQTSRQNRILFKARKQKGKSYLRLHHANYAALTPTRGKAG